MLAKLIENNMASLFMPHGLGHFIGMIVHAMLCVKIHFFLFVCLCACLYPENMKKKTKSMNVMCF